MNHIFKETFKFLAFIEEGQPTRKATKSYMSKDQRRAKRKAARHARKASRG